METIVYTKPVNPVKIFLAVILVVISIITIIYNKSIPILALIVIVYTLIQEGSEINLHNKMYRTFYSIFGIRFGKWKPIPNFEYVSVFSTA